MVTCLKTTLHKTNQKNHANQLILDKLCSLPVFEMLGSGCLHKHKEKTSFINDYVKMPIM